ncbi:hypothetical protein TELCIR_16607 [Teladorsagia circumcincta]|uniref:Uncharacterized protein n=1 Tax=Teladorsagia circumcincta TaxID=45464 RepID=A0A2G9TV52_TELCI|nr:hypothetical protein TELCIR_16607 [Teladorsagia circumcincta]
MVATLSYHLGSTLFTIVDVAQCLYTIQKFCFDFAAAFEFIEPDRLLTTAAKAQCKSTYTSIAKAFSAPGLKFSSI